MPEVRPLGICAVCSGPIKGKIGTDRPEAVAMRGPKPEVLLDITGSPTLVTPEWATYNSRTNQIVVMVPEQYLRVL